MTSSSTSGELPADGNVVWSSGSDVSEEVSHTHFLQMISFFDHLPTHLSSTCIRIQITHGTASSSSKAPTNRSASAADEANAPEKMSHLFNML